MKVVSLVYQYVQLRRLDDWLSWENAAAEEEMFLSQDEIRRLNSDFNYKHYGYFYEKLEELANLNNKENKDINEQDEEVGNEEEKQQTKPV